ncbi:MAG: membrane protein of unknown function [Promethearchaeota archaeon]|nr:MAG: membrane protein of unknown function [Candidatus Lokiarchaeota archaeon]
MKRERISTYIRKFGGIFLILIALIEMSALAFLFMMNININGNSMNFFNFAVDLNDLTLFVLWVSFMMILVCFLVLGVLLIKFASNTALDDYNYSKHMFIIAIIILVSGFIEWEYVYLIESYSLSGFLINGFIIIPLNNVKSILYYFDSSFYLWIAFYFTISIKIVLGLTAGGFGLHWVAKNEKKNTE